MFFTTYAVTVFSIFASALTSKSDTFTEELLLKPLYSDQLYAHFQFATKWDTDPEHESFKHTHLFPRALGEVVERYNVQELHVSLTGGLWRYETWGYPVVDAAPGAEVWAWFKEDTKDVDENWKELASSLSGLLCASLNFINNVNSISPEFTFKPRGVVKGQSINNTFVRYSSLPREIVCTENLTPWKKLLPCDSRSGLASLLNSVIEEDTQHIELNMFNQNEDKKLDWMYKGPNSTVDREEYLLGRKVDKTLEQLNDEEKQKQQGLGALPKNRVEHECIPPSIRDFNKVVQAEQVDLSAKLQEDPLVAIKKREEETRRQFLQNPVQLKKLQKALKAQQAKQNKKKKKKKKSKNSDSDESDLEVKLTEKLLGVKSKKINKAERDLDIILIHKYEEFKDKLTDSDIRDVLEGKMTDDSSDETSSSEEEKPKKKSKKKKKQKESSCNEESDNDKHYKKKHSDYKTKSKFKDDKNSNQDKHGSSRSRAERSRYSSLDRSKKSDNYRNRSRSRSNERRRNKPSKHNDNKESDSGYRNKRSRNFPETSSRYYDDESGSTSRHKRSSDKHSKHHSASDESDSESRHKRRNKSKSPVKEKHRHKRSSRSSSTSSEDTRKKSSKHYESDDSDAPKQQKMSYGLVNSEGKKIELKKSSIIEATTKSKASVKAVEVSKPVQHKAKKMSEEEKEKIRREMMKNAVQRDKERSHYVKKYRENEEKEAKQQDFDPDFVHKQLLKSTQSSTVESRIKSNLNKIQRSSRDMNTNFSRR